MERLKRVTPVPPSLAMSFGGASSLYRRAMVHQCRIGQAVAFLAGDEPLALAMLDTRRNRRAELAIRFRPAARQHMRALIREAQLTLPAFVQARILVFARISPRNLRGQRMARIAGFRPGGFSDPAIWLWKGPGHERNLWRRGCEATGRTGAARPAGGE
ncbi:hypothetical protein [uncultured Nitratireductor sp.]|uniref:hypothetical protein n=1 Tax=uncultured Nitratireductor sp. TaxID=520953 RepID=UPI0025CF6855|nr:hypothetical protein [uncultured Nitratireductor sp.]